MKKAHYMSNPKFDANASTPSPIANLIPSIYELQLDASHRSITRLTSLLTRHNTRYIAIPLREFGATRFTVQAPSKTMLADLVEWEGTGQFRMNLHRVELAITVGFPTAAAACNTAQLLMITMGPKGPSEPTLMHEGDCEFRGFRDCFDPFAPAGDRGGRQDLSSLLRSSPHAARSSGFSPCELGSPRFQCNK